MKEYLNYFKKFIKNNSVNNLFILVVLGLGIIMFIAVAIRTGIQSIISPTTDEVVFYSENINNYSYEEGSEYLMTKVDGYSEFFNTQDIIQAICKSLKNEQYSDVYAIFTKQYKDKLDSKDNVLVSLSNFYKNNFEGMDNIKINELYKIPNSTIFIAYIKNKSGENVRFVINVDQVNLTYRIEFLDL